MASSMSLVGIGLLSYSGISLIRISSAYLKIKALYSGDALPTFTNEGGDCDDITINKHTNVTGFTVEHDIPQPIYFGSAYAQLVQISINQYDKAKRPDSSIYYADNMIYYNYFPASGGSGLYNIGTYNFCNSNDKEYIMHRIKKYTDNLKPDEFFKCELDKYSIVNEYSNIKPAEITPNISKYLIPKNIDFRSSVESNPDPVPVYFARFETIIGMQPMHIYTTSINRLYTNYAFGKRLPFTITSFIVGLMSYYSA